MRNASNELREWYIVQIAYLLANWRVYSYGVSVQEAKSVIVDNVTFFLSPNSCKEVYGGDYTISIRVRERFTQRAATNVNVEEAADAIIGLVVGNRIELPTFQVCKSVLQNAQTSTNDEGTGLIIEKELTFSHFIEPI
jgi:hypothetical protein